ncbi:MAG: terminase [Anaerolineae bacterium]|nr:terminase [Anaerolineae bacterium]
MPQLVEIDDDRMTLNLHAGQSQVWNSDRRFIFMLAGTQSGKTSFGPHWLRREIDRCGPGDYIAATASYDLFKLKMLPAMLELFEHQLGIGRYRAGDKVLELCDPDTGRFRSDDGNPAWGRVILRSANAPGGLESATAKAAWLDECGQDGFTIDAWQAVLRRLSLSQGRVLATTTPYNLGWIKTQIFDRWAAGDDSIAVIQFASIENPQFPHEEFDRARATMPPWKFRMFYEGVFDRPPGLIYDIFDMNRHVVAPYVIPYDWPRVVGLDFGGVNTAAVYLAQKPDETYVLYREYLGGGKTAAGHVAALLDKWTGPDVEAYGGAASEQQWRDEFMAAGLHVYRPHVSDVEVGIDRVYELLATDRLQVFSDCVGVIDQMGRYSRPVDEDGRVLEGIVDKHDYHYLDALRYAASSIGHEAVAEVTRYVQRTYTRR